MRLAIAIPCHTFVAPQMAQSLAAMCHDLPGVNIGIRFLGNAVSTFGRNELVRWAKQNHATHMLWIDTDMEFPASAGRSLLTAGVPFIGANYALKDGSGRSVCTAQDGSRVAPKDEGIEAVTTMGFGLTLTAMEVIDAVCDPWFKVLDECRVGPADEIRFCERATKRGFFPHIDHALSKECRHVGFTEYELVYG